MWLCVHVSSTFTIRYFLLFVPDLSVVVLLHFVKSWIFTLPHTSSFFITVTQLNTAQFDPLLFEVLTVVHKQRVSQVKGNAAKFSIEMICCNDRSELGVFFSRSFI